MKLEGLHILLTYQCTSECDHCFVWGSPWQTGTLTLEQIEQILAQAKEAGVTPFILRAASHSYITQFWFRLFVKPRTWVSQLELFRTHIGRTTVADAEEWLRPFVGRLADLTVSSDLFHCSEEMGERPQNALVAAKWLNIPTGMIRVAQPNPRMPSSHMVRSKRKAQ